MRRPQILKVLHEFIMFIFGLYILMSVLDSGDILLSCVVQSLGHLALWGHNAQLFCFNDLALSLFLCLLL